MKRGIDVLYKGVAVAPNDQLYKKVTNVADRIDSESDTKVIAVEAVKHRHTMFGTV